MEMSFFEKIFIRSWFRVYMLRKYEAPRVLGGLNLPAQATCLEVGCGRGAGTLLIRQYTGCKRIVGLDIDPAMIGAARKYVAKPPRWARDVNTENIEFVCHDATILPFPDESFEAAFVFDTLVHIREWRQVIAEVYRVLKPGSVFSFEDVLASPSGKSRFGHIQIADTELGHVLEESGFTIRSFEKGGRLSMVYVRAVKPAEQLPGQTADSV
jgi:ubiquinone/menaquinone biosynthesis C-methylase UbiE